MKKISVIICIIILCACAWLTSCKKESTQVSLPAENANQIDDLQVGNNSSCKLTHNAWSYFFTWDFHYNNKGLADEWKIDGYSWVENFKMKYDKFNKLTEATCYDAYDNLILTTSFTYSGNRVIKQTWVDILTGTSTEILFSYNNKGQIVREDGSDDTHQLQTYDNMGNCTRSDYYIGSDLYFSDIYEFNSPVRNPLLTVSGVDFLFPYSGVGYFNKLWFTRNLSIIYDGEGNAFVINDLGASKKDFNVGYQHFPISVHYYDEASASPLDFSFGYSLNGNNNFANSSPQGNSTTGTNKTIRHPRPILLIGSGKSIKEQLQELRKQYGK